MTNSPDDGLESPFFLLTSQAPSLNRPTNSLVLEASRPLCNVWAMCMQASARCGTSTFFTPCCLNNEVMIWATAKKKGSIALSAVANGEVCKRLATLLAKRFTFSLS
jgi:F0F1-type ATP synthase assembly protein I